MPELFDLDNDLQTAREILTPWEMAATTPEPGRLDVIIDGHNLLAAVKALLEVRWGYLAAITGLDRPGASAHPDEEKQWIRLDNISAQQSRYFGEGTFEVLYHFCHNAAVLTLRVFIAYSSPVISSVCQLIPTATLYERELIEMFGVRVQDTPNTDRFLLPDDWPAGVYPLRKSFHGLDEESSRGD